MFKLITAAACLALAGAAQAETGTYAIDPTHTYATFEIGHMGTSTLRGRFDKKEGSVQFDRAGKTGRVEITIDTTSISTGTPVLTVAVGRRRLSSPRLAAASMTTEPWIAAKRPRMVEVPKCSNSKCTRLWSGSST